MPAGCAVGAAVGVAEIGGAVGGTGDDVGRMRVAVGGKRVAVGGTGVADGGIGVAVGVAWAHPPKSQMIVVSKMLLRQERTNVIALPPASC